MQLSSNALALGLIWGLAWAGPSAQAAGAVTDFELDNGMEVVVITWKNNGV